jgi:FAD/FMN-containing dehydrogenase
MDAVDSQEIARALAQVVDAADVTTDPSELAEYGRDWTRVLAPAPCAVVFPRTAAHVQRIVKLANERKFALVPSGGRTGLAGGAMAPNGEIVVSLSKMRAMGEVDLDGSTVHVQAGAVTQAVHEHVKSHGLTWPVDFASKGSSQVGGNIATNAGGVRVIRYGSTRAWVLGLTVVTGAGDILELNGALEKNNTGMDLRQLFIGSEGILGIVTEATLKLTKLPEKTDVMLFAVSGIDAVLALFREAKRAAFTLSAYEFFTDACFARLSRHRNVRWPFGAPSTHAVLVEAENAGADAIEAFMMKASEEGIIADGVLAQHATQARELWALREGISESLSATGMPHKNDISLPIAALAAFTRELDAVFAREYQGWELCVFGHVGDGNLHINVMKPDAMEKPAFLAKTKEADAALFALVQKHGGSISAEHGIGLLKKPYLHYTRNAADVACMRAVKRAFDPNGVLNPGKVLD